MQATTGNNRKRSCLLLVVLMHAYAFGQIPMDNPYRSFYHTGDHWTDSLPWTHVINEAAVKGLVDEKGNVDSLLLHQAMVQLSGNGGGVLYFAPGKYYFRSNVEMVSGVILRGGNIIDPTSAKDPGYRPSTQFIFPKYIPSFEDTGTPAATAFKMIKTENEPKTDFGIVNIDVNRAMINFSESFEQNVIIFGIRSNNAAYPSRRDWVDVKRQGWQRYPDDWEANIIVNAKSNALVANCRLNDSITDDFEMPDFMTNDGYVFKDLHIRFQYGLHRDIIMHSDYGKIDKLEIRDNWVKTCKSLPAMDASEKNITIKDNQLEEMVCQDLVETNGIYLKALIEKTEKAFGRAFFVNKGNDTLEYRLLKPKNYDPAKKYPFVLFFHGVGEVNNPLAHFTYIFTKGETMDNHPCFVLVPYMRRMNSKDITMTMELMDELTAKYAIDKKMTTVSGLSTGGVAVWNAILREPKRFSRVLLMSCYKSLDEKQLESLHDLSFFISAGTRDGFIPIQYSRLMVYKFKYAKINVQYYEYDTPHLSWVPLCLDDKFLTAFFNSSNTSL